MAWLAKCALVIVVSGGIGALIGVGLSKLTGGEESAGAPAAPGTTTPSGGNRTTSAPTAAVVPKARVRVGDAVLHPAATPSGVQRNRARLTVRITAENKGDKPLTAAPPVLLAGGWRRQTDSQADGPGTTLGPLAPGDAKAVTLRFETAGALTAQLIRRRTARVLVAGQSVPLRITLGNPVAVEE